MKAISGFKDGYRFLSNMYLLPRAIRLNGYVFYTSEAYYQAMKTTDKELRLKILEMNPYESRRFAKKIELRPDWDDIKLKVMLQVVRVKFKLPEMAEMLLATGDAYIEETNYWNDTFWGVCKGVGENNLGKILMRVRGELNNV